MIIEKLNQGKPGPKPDPNKEFERLKGLYEKKIESLKQEIYELKEEKLKDKLTLQVEMQKLSAFVERVTKSEGQNKKMREILGLPEYCDDAYFDRALKEKVLPLAQK